MTGLVVRREPIILERSQYWPNPVPQWYEAHNAFAVTAPAQRWYLTEGRVGNPALFPPANYQTYVLIANFGTAPASVSAWFHPPSGGSVYRSITVPARRMGTSATGRPGR
jgi:hypothetical protein